MFYEYLLCETFDGTIWVVKGRAGRDLVLKPKYIPCNDKPFNTVNIHGSSYTRLHSPVFSKTERIAGFEALPKPFRNLYQVKRKAIVKLYDILPEHNSDLSINATSFLDEAKKVLGNDITLGGSISGGFEKDGFSDIDFIFFGAEIFKSYLQEIKEREFPFSRLTFRGEKEWNEFYAHYGVKTSLTRAEFAKEMSDNNFEQGLLGNIPFSIFIARRQLKDYAFLYKNVCEFKTIHGTIKRIEKYYMPFTVSVKSANCTYCVDVWDRSLKYHFHNNDEVEICGYQFGNFVVVPPVKECYIKNDE